MPVQQHTLNWLYSVLTSEYHDVNRAYNDVAQTLTRYPSLSPRTDVHTFPNGSSALLLHLSGTIPVAFRGNTYRFPLSIWIPHAYPREAPLLYVTPTDAMVVRPGQYVDPQGQIYHPYLATWVQSLDRSNLLDFLGVLAEVFAKEPPVVARQRPMPRQAPHSPQFSANPRSPHGVQSPPPLPPQPKNARSPFTNQPQTPGSPRPPPPPPKTHVEPASQQSAAGVLGAPRIPSQPVSTSARHSRYESAPPLPREVRAQTSFPQQGSQAQGQPPMPALPLDLPHRQQQYPLPAIDPLHQQHSLPYHGTVSQGNFPTDTPAFPDPATGSLGRWQGQHSYAAIPHGQPQLPTGSGQQPAARPAPTDLMDEPLTLNMPTQVVAAPPIPPNPEKDALLRQLAQALYEMRHHSKQQNEGSLAGLDAQRNAMLNAVPAVQAEMGQLTQLSNAVALNQNILHEALCRADEVIEGSKSHPAPDVDELLVAPTVVGNQLYTLVAEERALGDAIFMLGRAVERGRISTAVFSKMTRSLAREWYLKKALVRKIGEGMGLQ